MINLGASVDCGAFVSEKFSHHFAPKGFSAESNCKTSPHFRLIVTVPNGGEVWSTGRSQTIRWSSSGISGGVKIEISRDGGMSWSTLNYKTSNDGAQKWSVKGPATTPGANPDLQFACSDHLWHQQR